MFYNKFKYVIIFLYKKILYFNIYLLINKFNKIIFITSKIFLNNIKYNNYRYTRFRINCESKFDNYKIKTYRLFKNII